MFLGLNQRTGELFALKQVPLSDETDAEVMDLESEIRLMKVNRVRVRRKCGRE